MLTLPDTPKLTACGAAVFATNIVKCSADSPANSMSVDNPSSEWQTTLSFLASALGKRRREDLLSSWGTPEPQAQWGRGGFDHHLFHVRNDGEDRDKIAAHMRELISKQCNLKNIQNGIRMLYLVSEMIRNTIDHSTSDAFLGIEITDDRKITRFAYCETGSGICAGVRETLKNNGDSRWEKEGITGLIHWALQPGNTSKPKSNRNMGMGMTIITESSAVLNYSLSIFDASSQIFVSDIARGCSHFEIRRRTIRTVTAPCFMYLGELMP